MNGNEMQILGIALILCGFVTLVGGHFLLKLWKRNIFRSLNGNQNIDEYGGGYQ